MPLFAIIVAMALAGAGRWWWFAELFCHFRAQYLAGLLVLAIGFALGRKWRWLGACAVLALWNATLITPAFVPPASDPVARRHARILFLNVEKRNADHAAVLRLVDEVDPDVACFVEVDPVWMRALLPLMARYPDVCTRTRGDAFGVAAFSRLPCTSEIVFLGGELPSTLMRLDGLTIVGTHPVPPMSADHFRWRNDQLRELARFAAAQGGPTIIGGDFNCTPWSPMFTDLLRDGLLHDSRRGFGNQASWPSFFPPLWIPIDHCVHSAGIAVDRRAIGRRVGSDHHPVIVDIRY
ncbi:MAG: endonuclease/exonuclease/phosphatase family protein [Planctomycetes bacterium]|nr:endonuclease/exonuclease/phosphatase family protein [Planctomycetota bacterium]